MRRHLWIILFSFFLAGVQLCNAQGNDFVLWHFQVSGLQGDRATLYVTATLAPGWHLYSQFLKPGGPIPTRFLFEPGDDYQLLGITRERGMASRFHDDVYGMEITWYSKEVLFTQDIRLLKAGANLKGKIEYMVCNEEMCIPGEREFSVTVK